MREVYKTRWYFVH